MEEIEDLLQEHHETARQITASCYELTLYGNGITRDDAFRMSFKEREMYLKLVTQKLQAASGNPKKTLSQEFRTTGSDGSVLKIDPR